MTDLTSDRMEETPKVAVPDSPSTEPPSGQSLPPKRTKLQIPTPPGAAMDIDAHAASQLGATQVELLGHGPPLMPISIQAPISLDQVHMDDLVEKARVARHEMEESKSIPIQDFSHAQGKASGQTTYRPANRVIRQSGGSSAVAARPQVFHIGDTFGSQSAIVQTNPNGSNLTTDTHAIAQNMSSSVSNLATNYEVHSSVAYRSTAV